MKIQIDTAAKTVLVLEACTLDELTAFLCRVDPERAGQYRISLSETTPVTRTNFEWIAHSGGVNLTDTGIRYTVDGLPRTDGYHETINKVN